MSVTLLPLHPSDLLAELEPLNVVERGIFVSLIAAMYDIERPIPNDPERLWRMCGCRSRFEFEKALEALTLLGKVKAMDGGFWCARAERAFGRREVQQ